ncbi:glycosyl transferase family 2 [Clostridium botulinum]|uniref:glycosyltransferase family 2 protein n=1 Tax=Clostridium botulinum TaxID=1491 RepID=UPI0009472FB1|nr:glycosyltransferase [Clostridium botulinum]APQ75723.1 glycosyltransferase like 2 family protein [Clostridium botulinum]AUM99966.1 glycosyl transferase family 2 [Clostridium botulinum]MBN3345366.1 glycosyl transferase family 2 [Clostridium botulinum]MBN3354663.1 glycosyl transferase family 2 [Clostridium botulinum]QDY29796.1 glycosyl transferase family 2 [Clostridium botulinum]
MSINSLISVIMPVYNAEKYLRESIESILNQTYKNFEFIIINDGSTDYSLKIINEYYKKDCRIKIISRENKGLVYSLNEGISIAKGEYIARMDGDDVCNLDRLEKQIKYMKFNPNVDILGSYVEIMADKEVSYRTINIAYEGFNVPINKNNIKNYLFLHCTICHPSSMMKKVFLEEINFYSNRYKTSEDYDLWMRALKRGYNIDNIKEPLLKYRLHKESKSQVESKSNVVLIDYTNIRLDYIEELLQNKSTYAIWGASKGGEFVKDIIAKRFPNLKLKYYIDKYKIGNLKEIDIKKPNILINTEIDYIFIATTPGRIEARKYLLDFGYKEIEEFMTLL